ncbi:MAG: hypothetical protein JEZ01_20500 [Labilibaculum sp.]|nr:hypothetical protein [Labilibaculum sp.]MBI9060160.1 hypothetical protein [Labilibaculum sp.]
MCDRKTKDIELEKLLSDLLAKYEDDDFEELLKIRNKIHDLANPIESQVSLAVSQPVQNGGNYFKTNIIPLLTGFIAGLLLKIFLDLIEDITLKIALIG